MSILVDKHSRILVQGITGKEGLFHAQHCHDYGANVVGGVTPGKGGETALNEGLPVFDSCLEAVAETGANVSLIFVPPAFAAEAILEAAMATIPLIVCITEGIPVADMKRVLSVLEGGKSMLIGPNCPGLLTPGEAKVGIMPGFIAKKGSIGVISKSGTLTYEAVQQIGEAGLGQSTCVGIGGDPLIGTHMNKLLDLFEADDDTEAIVLIGEIGGSMEVEAAKHVKENLRKPVVSFIAGRTAPPGRRMGHAGAIVSNTGEDALSKVRVMRESGIRIAESPALIGAAVREALR